MVPQRLRAMKPVPSCNTTATDSPGRIKAFTFERPIVQVAVILAKVSPAHSPTKRPISKNIDDMKPRLPILLSAALLAAAILLVFKDELHARGPNHLNRQVEPTECGFWGPMSAGMSCR
jgi:hypothetical protein